jgi:hypothetical protein
MSDSLRKKISGKTGSERNDALKDAPIEELKEYLRIFLNEDSTRLFVKTLVSQKEYELLKKPHWSITPSFYLLCFSVLLTFVTVSLTIILYHKELYIVCRYLLSVLHLKP